MTDLYEVEEILKHRRGRKGGFEYFVKWKGYGDEDNIWIPEINFGHDRTMIDEYFKEIQGKQPPLKKDYKIQPPTLPKGKNCRASTVSSSESARSESLEKVSEEVESTTEISEKTTEIDESRDRMKAAEGKIIDDTMDPLEEIIGIFCHEQVPGMLIAKCKFQSSEEFILVDSEIIKKEYSKAYINFINRQFEINSMEGDDAE